jgi:hypothetical protein
MGEKKRWDFGDGSSPNVRGRAQITEEVLLVDDVWCRWWQTEARHRSRGDDEGVLLGDSAWQQQLLFMVGGRSANVGGIGMTWR